MDYYATFDNFKVGVQQATSLLVGLGLKKEDGTDGTATGPFNVELFAGSPDDNNATFFFNGAMETLKPYIDKGTLVVKSGQTDFKTVAILRWDPATAQKRMEDLITKSYTGSTKVNGVLSPYDGLSIGILSALKSSGYGTPGQPYPIVTGQDAEVASVKSIIAGEQYATIYKDTRELADERPGTHHGEAAGGPAARRGRRHGGPILDQPAAERHLHRVRRDHRAVRGC